MSKENHYLTPSSGITKSARCSSEGMYLRIVHGMFLIMLQIYCFGSERLYIFVCGWFCVVGWEPEWHNALQEMLHKLRNAICSVNLRINKWKTKIIVSDKKKWSDWLQVKHKWRKVRVRRWICTFRQDIY